MNVWDQAIAELAEQTGQRVRVLDEHMYRIDTRLTAATTMRLQLFTAAGLRPVAVVTQTIGEGCSLVNCAETFASHVWQTHFPDEALPPLWVQRLILAHTSGPDFTLVWFDVEPELTLSSPRWLGMTQAELARVVGAPVDPSRGQGFVPRPPEPEYRPHWVPMALAAMPNTRPFRATCMTGAGPHARAPWWRQLLSARRPSAPAGTEQACCWYHGGDWQRVHNIVARLLPAAQTEAPDDIGEHILDAARAEGVTGWTWQALTSLFEFPISITDSDRERAMFINGQHRVQAMRDAGLTHTFVVEHDEVTENPTTSVHPIEGPTT